MNTKLSKSLKCCGFFLYNQALDTVVCTLGDSPHHGPVLLAWATLKQLLSGDEALVTARKLGNKAVQLHVFKYIVANLNSEPFNGSSVSKLYNYLVKKMHTG